jgi:hypothetical protein
MLGWWAPPHSAGAGALAGLCWGSRQRTLWGLVPAAAPVGDHKLCERRGGAAAAAERDADAEPLARRGGNLRAGGGRVRRSDADAGGAGDQTPMVCDATDRLQGVVSPGAALHAAVKRWQTVTPVGPVEQLKAVCSSGYRCLQLLFGIGCFGRAAACWPRLLPRVPEAAEARVRDRSRWSQHCD